MKITVINGPNLNMLGIREPGIYGNENYAQLVEKIQKHCQKKGIDCEVYQSNHEGAIIDQIQACYGRVDGIVINAGGYTHTSIAILDALKAVAIRTVEVHISDLSSREAYRQISYIGEYAEKTVVGMGTDGYIAAIDHLLGDGGAV